MYTPQYPVVKTPKPLELLGGTEIILITGETNSEHVVIGGIKPYRLINPEKKVGAALSLETNGLVLKRTEDSKNKDETTIYVIDANDTYVGIHIVLPAKAAIP